MHRDCKPQKAAGTKRRDRTCQGSSIAEFAPALYGLLLLAIFPMIDLIGLTVSYSACQYLEFNLLHQAGMESCLTLDTSMLQPTLKPDYSFVTAPNGAFQDAIRNWYNGAGHFAIRNLTDVQVGAKIELTQNLAAPKYVIITTSVLHRPVIQLPFLYDLPGFSKPIRVSTSGKAVIENVPG